VIKSHDVGTIRYIEWLILIDRVQPSFIAGVCGVCTGHQAVYPGESVKGYTTPYTILSLIYPFIVHPGAGSQRQQPRRADHAPPLLRVPERPKVQVSPSRDTPHLILDYTLYIPLAHGESAASRGHAPLRYWLFTPGLQWWQSRVQTASLTGVSTNWKRPG
jgi:hypothetical protein